MTNSMQTTSEAKKAQKAVRDKIYIVLVVVREKAQKAVRDKIYIVLENFVLVIQSRFDFVNPNNYNPLASPKFNYKGYTYICNMSEKRKLSDSHTFTSA